MIRVVHVITDLDVGGAEMTLARLVVRPNRHSAAVAVIGLGSRGPLAARIEAAGVPVFALGIRAGGSTAAALWRLVSLLRRFRPHVVQTWLYHADLAGIVAGALARVPHVVWNIRCAELDPRDHPRSLPALLRALALMSGRPAAVVCNSEAGRRAHERLGYRPRRWEIIANGFDTDTFHPCADAGRHLRRELGLEANARVVGLLARFHPMKDHPTFLEAARIITASRTDVHFVAAGRGVPEAAAIEEWLTGSGMSGHVHLLPEQPEPSRFLAGLDVAVSSSYGEAFPNVVAEAMACGTASVATDVGESARIIGNAGIVVPPRDAAALAAAVVRLLDLDGPAREALQSAARQRIVSNYSIDRSAARFDELYADIAGAMNSRNASICVG